MRCFFEIILMGYKGCLHNYSKDNGNYLEQVVIYILFRVEKNSQGEEEGEEF